MDKDTDSMATVQMKPEYAPSEVYSTASEPPPAYKMRPANSVQIAKIIALTVIVSSFIIGSFILGATYLQAKASCDQVQVLDAMLDKELMLEAMQQDTPKAEALQAHETTYDNGNAIDDENLTKDMKHDEDVNKKPIETNNKDAEAVPENDSSFSENDETEELNKNRVHIKLPLEFDLSDLANAILENNQKSRMNCVVERRRAEEFVDAPGRTMQLPFGLNLTTEPKKQRITGERMVIFCESGTETKNEDSEPIKQIVMPIQAVPISYRPQMQQIPFEYIQRVQQQQQQQQQEQQQIQQQQLHFQQQLQQSLMGAQHPMIRSQQTPMMGPQQHPMMYGRVQMVQPSVHEMPPPPPPQVQQMPPHIQQYQIPFQQIIAHQMQQEQQEHQEQIPVPSQEMEPPRPAIEQQVRIQLQSIPTFGQISQVRGIQMPTQEAQEQNPHVQVQQVPLAEALKRAGITPEDLRNIQRMAEERIQQELRELGAADDSSDSDSSSEEDDSQQSQEQQQQQQHSIPPQFLQIGRSAFGRSLATPVRIPVPMMQEQANEAAAAANSESERPHYVHPRSVRSVDNVLHREKRIKRCACDCNC